MNNVYDNLVDVLHSDSGLFDDCTDMAHVEERALAVTRDRLSNNQGLLSDDDREQMDAAWPRFEAYLDQWDDFDSFWDDVFEGEPR